MFKVKPAADLFEVTTPDDIVIASEAFEDDAWRIARALSSAAKDGRTALQQAIAGLRAEEEEI